MIYLPGLLLFIGYRIFNAGMNTELLFYSTKKDWSPDFTKKVEVKAFDGDKLFPYVVTTLLFGFTWPVSLPAIGIYLLGKRFAK